MKINRKQLMKKAWQLAARGAKNFGGNVKIYFACALHIIWQELKTEKRYAWQPGLGFQMLLDGTPMPSAKMKRGQFGLPGLAI